MLGQLEEARSAWVAVLRQVPDTETAAAPITAIWQEKTELMIGEVGPGEDRTGPREANGGKGWAGDD